MNKHEHKPDMAYIGVRECGCVTFITLLDYGEAEDLAEDVSAVILSGRRIEQVPVAEAKARLTHECKHQEVAP